MRNAVYTYNNNNKSLSIGDLMEMRNAVNMVLATLANKPRLHAQAKNGVTGRVRNLLQKTIMDVNKCECYPLLLLDPNNEKLLVDELNRCNLLNSTEGTRVWSADGTTIKEDIDETLKMIKDPANLRIQVMIKKIQLQEDLVLIRKHFLDPASELKKKIESMQKKIDAAKQQILDIKSKGLAVDVSVLNGTIATIEAKQYNQLVEDNALTCNRIDGCIKAVDDELLRMASIKGITDAQRNFSYNEMLNGGGTYITGVGLIRVQDQLLSPAKPTMMNIIANIPPAIDVDINKLEVLSRALQAAATAAAASKPAAGAVPKPAPAGATPTPTATGAVPKPAATGAAPTPTAAGAMPKPAPTGAVPTPTAAGAVPKPVPTGATPTPTAAAGAVPKKPAPAARPLTDDERKAAFADYWRSNRKQFKQWEPGNPAPTSWEPTDDVANEIRKGTWKPRP